MNTGKRKNSGWQLWAVVGVAALAAVILTVNLIRAERVKSENTIRVLYIGNSLTSANNLPRMIADLAKSNHRKIVYDVYAPGGRRFSQHAMDANALRKIEQRPWDFVVLQEQSQMPAMSRSVVEKHVFSNARILSRKIRSAHPHTKIVFYQTMARKNGDRGNARVSRELETYWSMQDRINRSYLEMAQDNRAMLAPIGSVWKKARFQKASLNLYADPVHPNVRGSYLSACVFYTIFFQDSPVGLSRPRQVDSETAKYLQDLVHREVFLSPSKLDWSP